MAAYELRIGGGVFRQTHESSEPELVFHVPEMAAVEVSWSLDASQAGEGWLHCDLRPAASEGIPLAENFYATPAGRHRFDPVLPGEYELVLYSAHDGKEIEWAHRSLVLEPGQGLRVEL